MRKSTVFLALLFCNGAQGASFMGLGDLPGGEVASEAFGVSPDGAVVVGRSANGGSTIVEAFRWTEGSGMQSIGQIGVNGRSSWARGTSQGGSIIVGNGFVGSDQSAFVWTSPSGAAAPDIPGGGIFFDAMGVSRDGQNIVGVGSFSYGTRGVTGNPTSGFSLLQPHGTDADCWANAVSLDGRVVAGTSANGGWDAHAVRWIDGVGLQDLGDLPGGIVAAEALGVSGDGSVVVGQSADATGDVAFRWTEDGGMKSLGDLLGGASSAFRSYAHGVSGDGSRVVGTSNSITGHRAFVWDEATGMRDLWTVLTVQLGLNLEGWKLTGATGISEDGLTIVGNGINPNGRTEAWVATIPEPAGASILLLFVGKIFLTRRGRHI